MSSPRRQWALIGSNGRKVRGIVSTPIPALGTGDDLQAEAERLEGRPAEEILRWALEHYGTQMALACSFGGPTGMVLLDMMMALEPRVPVFYLDTGLLFTETYALVAEVERRYEVSPIAVRPALSVSDQATLHSDGLWGRDPDRCCAIRKVAPQREFLRDYAAWITGLRRDQASTRRATPVVSWDAQFGLAKIAPLATWSDRDVWTYIVAHDVPYNDLHDRGYPSIGCTHCTRPVMAGEDVRAGRWSGTTKIECGLHATPGLSSHGTSTAPDGGSR
jgi:phosphoadenosine phosphosulfate reductase